MLVESSRSKLVLNKSACVCDVTLKYQGIHKYIIKVEMIGMSHFTI